jgi:hypothetical protein
MALPTEPPEVTLPDVSLELEVRPLAPNGLIFHLGHTQAPPYLQLQVLKEKVSRTVVPGRHGLPHSAGLQQAEA